MARFNPPYQIDWNRETRLFDVCLDGKLIGSHRGRGGAEKIGLRAIGTKSNTANPQRSQALQAAAEFSINWQAAGGVAADARQ